MLKYNIVHLKLELWFVEWINLAEVRVQSVGRAIAQAVSR
jgi:hypothetical protein